MLDIYGTCSSLSPFCQWMTLDICYTRINIVLAGIYIKKSHKLNFLKVLGLRNAFYAGARKRANSNLQCVLQANIDLKFS